MVTHRFVFYCLLAVVATFLLHEFTHWVIGELLGYRMTMTLNTVYPTKGTYVEQRHYVVVSFGGPLMTLLQAIVAYQLLKQHHSKNLFPFLFSCFYLEFMAGVMNFINPNDLGRVGRFLGIGLFTLPVLFITVHFLLLFWSIKREQYTRKFVFLSLFLILLFSSIWILLNQQFRIKLIDR